MHQSGTNIMCDLQATPTQLLIQDKTGIYKYLQTTTFKKSVVMQKLYTRSS